ncbi:UNVERIFIED_CONTAM: hypothetical protein Slati_3296500 [Sesamum latifolium]|uniref:Organ specific protein n=1 Tax=Sesamum latifolium TaxID=2727402 RepID=A0AAW2V089_9LAMI
MRAFSAPSFFLLSLLLFACIISDARKDPRDYWQSRMDGELMPKSITDLLPASDDPRKDSDRFVRNFETKPNVIIYHSHDHHHHDHSPSAVDG